MWKFFLDVLSLSISLIGSAIAASALGAGVAFIPYEMFENRHFIIPGWVIGVISFIVIFRFVFFRLVAFMRREYLN